MASLAECAGTVAGVDTETASATVAAAAAGADETAENNVHTTISSSL